MKASLKDMPFSFDGKNARNDQSLHFQNNFFIFECILAPNGANVVSLENLLQLGIFYNKNI